jgi:predicted amidohydrolase
MKVAQIYQAVVLGFCFIGLAGTADRFAAETKTDPATAQRPVSMANTVRVAAAQPKRRLIDWRINDATEVLRGVDQSLQELEQIIHYAGGAWCDALAFPEDTLGLGNWEAAHKRTLKEVLPEAVKRMLDRLGRVAASHRMYLVLCNDTLAPDGSVRNTAFLLRRDGQELGRYHKVNMPIHELDKKRGDEFSVFPTADLGGVGMLICYDMVFPESARCLTLGGADIIFHPTLGGAAIGDEEISRAAFRTRAVENFIYLVVAQRGRGSMIISPQGKILAEAKGADSLAIADIDPFAGREGGDAMNHQRDMRARLFRERSPAAFSILTSGNPPILAKVPETMTVAEAVDISARTLTVGEERFKEADALLRSGKTNEAIVAFEELRREFRQTWIDRVSQQRLAQLGGNRAGRNPSMPPHGSRLTTTALRNATCVAAVDQFKARLERLRTEDPGEFDKVQKLMKVDCEATAQFLRQRFPKAPAQAPESKSNPVAQTTKKAAAPLPPRLERFVRIETLSVGEFAIDLCRREDGAFGLGEIRHGTMPLRRTDFLITWQVDGKFPVFDRRNRLTIKLRDPPATLTFTAEARECAGTRWIGFQMKFQAGHGPLVETASWEVGGSTRGLSYFDGYRGWHAPPGWLQADAVPPTNPKLTPSLLAGTGFQFEHGPGGALVHFHTTPGDHLGNVSHGEALEFETAFHGSATVERFIFVASGDDRLNLWTRAYEVAQAELRRAFGLPEPGRDIFLQWPPFSRKGFHETARECAAVTAREGFTGASIDVIWDNADFHGGAKNMNVWDYTVCEGYGGEAGLKELMIECQQRNLHVIAWVPAGHLWSRSPVWTAHPDWVLLNARGEKFVNPAGGIWHGALDSGFHDYWRGRVVNVVRRFGFDGLWLDTHLSYAQQSRPPTHGAKLSTIYRDFIKAGARRLLVEGDASVFGSYTITIADEWEKEWGKVPNPDLYYGATLAAGSMNPAFYLANFRRYVAAGAPWILNWDFLFSSKLSGDELDAARHEVRQVAQDYRRVKDRMVHRFAHADGSGYTWTSDRDRARVVWLLKDAPLPDGRRGEAGQVYVID